MTASALLCVSSMVVLAAPNVAGELTVSGSVTVNGQTAVSNSTVISGSTIVTGAGSSATVSLGKNGRVQIASGSSLTLNFTDSSISGILNSGKVTVSNAAGIPATITTKDASAVADTSQASIFTVEACSVDNTCACTHVDTAAGLVILKDQGPDKQVAAGSSFSSENASQTGCKPCFRPGSAPPVSTAGFGAGPIALILLAAAGAAATAIIWGTKTDTEVGGSTVIPGNTIIVSPSK